MPPIPFMFEVLLARSRAIAVATFAAGCEAKLSNHALKGLLPSCRMYSTTASLTAGLATAVRFPVLHRRDGVGGGADGAGEAQRRRGQQEARAAVGAQPVGEVGQQPDLAEID